MRPVLPAAPDGNDGGQSEEDQAALGITVDDAATESSQEKRPKWTVYQFFLVGVLILVAIMNHADRASVGMLQELIKPELGLSDWELGLLVGPAFAIFYSISGFPMARMAERMHRPKLLACAIAFWSSATAFSAGAMNFAHLALCRVGVGLGEGGANPISLALIGSSFSARQRGRAMSAFAAAGPIGVILAPILTMGVAHMWGWRAAFIALAIPGFLIALLLFFTVREPRESASAEQLAREKPKSFWEDSKHLARTPAFPLMVFGVILFGTGTHGMGSFTTSLLLREFELSLPEVGAIISVRGGIGLLGVLLGGILADKFADSQGKSYLLIPAIGTAVGAVFYFLMFRSMDVIWFIVLMNIANFAVDLKSGPLLAAVQNLTPDRMRATSTAYFFLGVTVFGSVVGSLMVGGLSDYMAAQSFASEFGAYSEVCRGGRAVVQSAVDVNEACATASGAGLRSALTVAPIFYLLAAIMFYLASRKAEIVKG